MLHGVPLVTNHLFQVYVSCKVHRSDLHPDPSTSPETSCCPTRAVTELMNCTTVLPVEENGRVL